MRRSKIVFFAVYMFFAVFFVVFFAITTAVSAADTKTATTKSLQTAVPAPAIAPATQAESPLVRAARIGLEARLHPKARIVINSRTLVVTSRYEPTSGAAPTGKEAEGRSWASGNQNDPAAIAAREQSARDQRTAAEHTRQEAARQDQTYTHRQAEEPYEEGNDDDHATRRPESIPSEIKQKPPM